MMKEFTSIDWYSCAGAEKFEDGSQPLIGVYGALTVVVDRNGLQAWIEEREDEAFILMSSDKQYCLDVAENLLSEVKGLTPNRMQKVLNEM